MRLGLFGGTFDPPHTGHLVAAQDAMALLGLDRIFFIPAAQPPHKRDRALSPAALRAGLVSAAIAGDARFELDDIELTRQGPSYTVDTLLAYRSRYPDAALYLLLGIDQYADLESWRRPEEIRRLAMVAVLDRAGEPVTPAAGVVRVAVTRVDVSSTGIRERVRQGRPIRYLVPAAVEALIRSHGLYQPTAAPHDPAGR